MRKSVVPAQITTVEDRVLGNLTPYQAGLISAPLVFGIVVYAMLPPNFHLVMYKIGIVVGLELIGGVLSIKKDDQMLAFWIAKRLRYNMRSRLYIYDKNDDFLRSNVAEIPQSDIDEQQETEAAKTPTLATSEIGTGEIVRIEQIMADERANLRFKAGKDGKLYALIEEIK